MKIIIIYLVALTLVGCSNGGSSNNTPEDNVIVYVAKGNTQCNDDGMLPDESAQALVGAGIDVLETFCGVATGLVFAAVCGGGTADIIAHEIREVNLQDTSEIGYEDIETLVDVEKLLGYKISQCENT